MRIASTRTAFGCREERNVPISIIFGCEEGTTPLDINCSVGCEEEAVKRAQIKRF